MLFNGAFSIRCYTRGDTSIEFMTIMMRHFHLGLKADVTFRRFSKVRGYKTVQLKTGLSELSLELNPNMGEHHLSNSIL